MTNLINIVMDASTNQSYKVLNGTYYHIETSDAVVVMLEKCRERKTRVVLDYGDTKTLKSWGDKHDITGYVGRSCGRIKVPLLIYNKRSYGGGQILDNCIISIKSSLGKNILLSL